MADYTQVLSSLGATLLRIVLLVALAVGAFYLTVFVVSTGAGLAGYAPDGNFVVLAAALLVVAVVLAGGVGPRVTATAPPDGRRSAGGEQDDPAFD